MTHDATPLLGALVAIDSTNPDLVADGAGEVEISEFVLEWLVERGVDATMTNTAKPGRPNVVARVKGSGRAPTLILNAHMDTVGVDAMDRPFEPRVEHGRLYGRGALDTKGGLAAAMTAMAELSQEPPAGDVVLTAVADEEHASVGTEAIADLDAAGAIVFEPTDLAVVVAHKGFVWLDIEVAGKAAHGSRPDLGLDAITKAAVVLNELEGLNDVFASAEGHPLLTPESLHASLISGGQERSSYADLCRVGLEIRCHPRTPSEEILQLVQQRVDRLAVGDQDLDARISLVFERRGYECDPQSNVVQSLVTAYRQHMSGEPAIRGHDGWMDSALLGAAGIPSVVFGPNGEGLHAAVEWVDLDSVQKCRDITVLAAHSFGAGY